MLFLANIDPRSSITTIVFDCSLPSVTFDFTETVIFPAFVSTPEWPQRLSVQRRWLFFFFVDLGDNCIQSFIWGGAD